MRKLSFREQLGLLAVAVLALCLGPSAWASWHQILAGDAVVWQAQSSSPCSVGQRCTYVKTSDGLPYFQKVDGTSVGMTGGGGATFPLQNGSSPWTANSGQADGATAAYSFNTTNSFTSGNPVYQFKSNNIALVTIDSFGELLVPVTAGIADASDTTTKVTMTNGNVQVSSAGALTNFTSSGAMVPGLDGRILGDTTHTWSLSTKSIFAGVSTNTITASTLAGLIVTQSVQTSGSPTALTVTGAAHTTLTAATESNGALFDFSAIKQWATGGITTQRENWFRKPTYAFAGASTITTAATVAVEGAPVQGTNATLTESDALWVQAGQSRFDGTIYRGDGTALTLKSNVTMAGSGIGHIMDTTHALTDGDAIVSFRANNGTEYARLADLNTSAGVYGIRGGTGATFFSFEDKNGNGIQNDANRVIVQLGSTNYYQFVGASFNPFNDNANTSGTSGARWSTTYTLAVSSGASDLTLTPNASVIVAAGKYIKPGSVAFASLGTPADGNMTYCSDCTIANPCASGGSGAFAKRLNGTWVCN